MATKEQTELEQHLSTGRHGHRNVAWYHKLGQILVAMADANEGSRYGQGFINNLATNHEEKSFDFYRAIQVFKLFHGQSLDLVTQLAWSHAFNLAGVKDQAVREQLLKQAVAEKWSLVKLTGEIQGRLGVRRTRAGKPRPPVKSINLTADLHQVKMAAQKFIRLWNDLFSSNRREEVKADPILKVAMTQGSRAEKSLGIMEKQIQQWQEGQR